MATSPVTGDNQKILFIYGTLKRGFPNSQYLPAALTYLGTARSTLPFPLVADTEMGCPFLLNLPSHPNAHIVHGELYSAGAAEVDFLDTFEGVHTNFYSKEYIEVLVTADADNGKPSESPAPCKKIEVGTLLGAWTYVRGSGGPEWARKWTIELLQTLPMLERYSEEDCKRFVARNQRATPSLSEGKKPRANEYEMFFTVSRLCFSRDELDLINTVLQIPRNVQYQSVRYGIDMTSMTREDVQHGGQTRVKLSSAATRSWEWQICESPNVYTYLKKKAATQAQIAHATIGG